MQTYIKIFTCKPICLCFFNLCSNFLTFISFAAIYCVFVCQLVYAFKFVDIKKTPTANYLYAVGVLSGCVRNLIGLRSVSNRIASAVRSDRVRCPIGLRSVYDDKISRSMGKNVAEVSGLRSTKSNTNYSLHCLLLRRPETSATYS